MIAQMEIAAARLLSRLREGEDSIAVETNLPHLAKPSRTAVDAALPRTVYQGLSRNPPVSSRTSRPPLFTQLRMFWYATK